MTHFQKVMIVMLVLYFEHLSYSIFFAEAALAVFNLVFRKLVVLQPPGQFGSQQI